MARRKGPELVASSPREWVGGCIPAPYPEDSKQKAVAPDILIWLEMPGMMVLGSEPAPPRSGFKALGPMLKTSMQKPLTGKPRRPDRVRVASEELAKAVRRFAGKDVPVIVAPTPEIDQIHDMMADMLAGGHFKDDLPDSYLEGGDVSPEAVEGMFRAAAALFAVAPWKVATGDQAIRMDIPDLGVEGACLSIIGNLGESVGVLIFPDVEDFDEFWEASLGVPQSDFLPDIDVGWLALEFERGADLPDPMRQEVARYGWLVASPEAYPVLDRYDPGPEPVPLMDEDLRIVTACVTALTAFFVKHQRIFTTDEFKPVCESFFDRSGLEVIVTAPYEALDEFDWFDELDEVDRRNLDRLAMQPVRRQTPKLGRNDPCHCGSGRKYKNCQLREDEEAARAQPEEPPETETETSLLISFFHEVLEFALERFRWDWRLHRLDFDDAEDQIELALPWSVYGFEIEGKTALSWFLEEHLDDLSPEERDLAAAQQEAWLSVWEVTEVTPGEGMVLRDHLSGEVRQVRERTASRSLIRYDSLLGRVIAFEGGYVLDGMHTRPLKPHDAAEVVRLARGRLRRKRDVPVDRLRNGKFGAYLIRKWDERVEEAVLRASRPLNVTNTDGDPLLLTRDSFTIRHGAGDEIIRRLKGIEGMTLRDPREDPPVFTLSRPGRGIHPDSTNTMLGLARFEEGALILETNSVERADGLRTKVEAACGDAITHRLREHFDPASPAARAAAVRTGSLDRPENPEELRRAKAEVKARYYADWLDQSIPALDGLTPREAAKTAQGRRELDTLLKSMENMEIQGEGDDAFDFSVLRRDLGLE
ncbi:SEC-C domain-containing protein [bacterium]|nr:SEC-C domain-containing protein [bacterium]